MAGIDLGATLDSAQLTCVEALDGKSLMLAGEVVTGILSGDQTGGDSTVSRLFVLPQGGPPMHRHMQHETLFVLTGELEITGVRQRKFHTCVAGPGALVHIPGCVPHTFCNVAEAPATVLSFVGPAGLERFFAEAGMPYLLDSETQDGSFNGMRERFEDAALHHGIEPIDPELFDSREGYRATGLHFVDVEGARTFRLFNTVVRLLARNEQTDSQLTVLELSQPARTELPLHSHVQAAVFHVLDGEVEFQTVRDGRQRDFQARAGSTMLIPRSVAHAVVNNGDGTARMLGFYTPAGIETFILEAAEPLADAAAFLSQPASLVSPEETTRVHQIGMLRGFDFIVD